MDVVCSVMVTASRADDLKFNTDVPLGDVLSPRSLKTSMGLEGRGVRASLPFHLHGRPPSDFPARMEPDYSFELAAKEQGYARIAGVDEVGRGPLAGPVTAAAVVLDSARIPAGLNDSKKLTHKKRELLYAQIMEVADVSIAHATVEEIDEHNILRASHIAHCRPAGDEASKIFLNCRNGGLLQHDLAHPDGVGIRQLSCRSVLRRHAPRHFAGIHVVPLQQHYRDVILLTHCL